MTQYLKGFFIWWFYYVARIQLARFSTVFYFVANYTRTLPMFLNLAKPLYGDKSAAGRFMGIFIRFNWVIFGGAITALIVIPYFVLTLGIIFTPALVLVLAILAII